MRHRILADLVASSARPSMKICDFGCGDGGMIRSMAANLSTPVEFFGVDVSQEGVGNGSLGFEFRQGDLSSREFKVKETFDIAVSSEVLEHVTDPQCALNNIFAALKPGGLAFLSVPSGPIFSYDRRIGHLRHFLPETLASMMEKSGFEAVRVQRFGFPVHTAYKFLAHLLPARSQNQLMAMGRPGLVSRLVLGLAYYLMMKSVIPWGGLQIFATARRREA